METDGEENETTAGLDEKGLLLLGQVDLTDKLAMNIVSLGIRLDSAVNLLALGQESRLRKVVIGLGKVDLASALLGRSSVDIDASKTGGDLLGRCLEVVLCDSRHGGYWWYCGLVVLDGLWWG